MTRTMSDRAMETSEEYIWLFERGEYGELAGSILVSVLFHALLFAILASTTIFHPLPGESDRVDVLWYYPSLSPGHRAAPVERPLGTITAVAEKPPLKTRQAPAAISAAKAPQPPAARVKTVENRKAADVTPPPPPPPKIAVAEQTARPVITVPEEEPETETEPEMVIPAAIEPPPEAKSAISKTGKPAEKKVAEPDNNRQAAPKTAPPIPEQKKPAPSTSVETPIREAKPASPSSIAEPLRLPAAKGIASPATSVAATPPSAAASPATVQAARTRGETGTTREVQPGPAKTTAPSSFPGAAPVPGFPKGVERKETAAALRGAPRPAAIAGAAKGPAAGKEVKAAPAAKTAPEAKHSEKKQFGAAEGKGIFFPPVTGDLKLEISGKDELLQELKVVVLFREYPKARRNRPLSRAEFKRARTLTPRVVRSGESSRQAVIEVTGEGIYEFMVESAAEQPEATAFTLKLYEKSSRARTKPLGSRRIAHSESVVKVLMPEGILWSEDAAFSGSIEDSDSVTKFNTENGLLWKEYK
ncbi:MAG TPA: hypothetical protein VF799_08255 [Geobacteraceae bacterium]